MVGEAIAICLCVLAWAARLYVATKYQLRYKVAGQVRWTWKRATPDWITRVTPWLSFLSWVALLGLVFWWAYRYR